MHVPDTTKYDFNQIIDRRNSDSVKWRNYEADVLPMWVADMDFISPKPVIEALLRRANHGVFGYAEGIRSNSEEIHSLTQTVIDRLATRHDWHIAPEDVVLMPGVVRGFNLACHANAGPTDAVLIQTPVYPPILQAAKTTHIQRQEMQLTREADGSYHMDWDAFANCFNDQTRLFILCNPHNPVGKVFTRAELEKMAEICLRNQTVIVSDEIHCDLVFEGHAHIPIAALAPEIAQQTITLISPSKTFNIAGLDCSFAIIQNPTLRKRYTQAQQGLVSSVNLFGLAAAQAAYREGEPWLEQVMEYLQDNRDFLYDYVNKHLPGIEMGLPEGTYLAWLDCRKTGIVEDPYRFFLEEARVALNDGATFGPGGKGFVRLNFACPRSILEQGLARMKDALTRCSAKT